MWKLADYVTQVHLREYFNSDECFVRRQDKGNDSSHLACLHLAHSVFKTTLHILFFQILSVFLFWELVNCNTVHAHGAYNFISEYEYHVNIHSCGSQ